MYTVLYRYLTYLVLQREEIPNEFKDKLHYLVSVPNSKILSLQTQVRSLWVDSVDSGKGTLNLTSR